MIFRRDRLKAWPPTSDRYIPNNLSSFASYTIRQRGLNFPNNRVRPNKRSICGTFYHLR